MRSRLRSSGILVGFVFLLLASGDVRGIGMPFGAEPETPGDLVGLAVSWERESFAPGEEVRGVVTATIAEGWHINSVAPFPSPGGG